jgi:surfactin family lipopeptide synthetase A
MSSTSIVIISSDSHTVNEEPCLNPENGAAWGLMRVVDLECPSFRIQCVDVHLPLENPGASAEQILSECCNPNPRPEVAYRGGKRWLPNFEPFDHAQSGQRDLLIQEDATYLITGGTGGLGLEVARWLADKQRVKLALIGRRPLPEKDPGDERSQRVLEVIEELRAQGHCVLFLSVDVGDRDALTGALARVRRELGPIRGLFHAAGVNKDKFLRAKDETSFRQVLHPKVRGTWHLEQLTRNDPLDFMVLFSSVVSLSGNVGQCDYAAANRYLG